MPEIRARVHLWTVPDYRVLAEDNPAFRYPELIRGVIMEREMKTPLHNFMTKKLYDFLHRSACAGLVARQEVSLRLSDSVPEADVAVVRGEEKDFRFENPTAAELVVEVAVTSLASDREKARLYAEASVGEYWIVLAETGQIEVYRRPETVCTSPGASTGAAK